MKEKLLFAALLVAGIPLSTLAQRAPTATYTVSGTAHDWTLDFNVKNNYNSGEGQIYFFGVLLDSGRDILSSPGVFWSPNSWTSYNNSSAGGSNTTYNNVWLDYSFTGQEIIREGQSLSGFEALSTDATAPSSVKFFAYTAGGTYQGTGYFNTNTNPGFEGIATPQSVPEPAELGALALGVLPLLLKRRAK